MNKLNIKQIFIAGILAIILEFITISPAIDITMPFWVLIFYSYFLINFTINQPFFGALIVGILLDSVSGSILGQNALALIFASFFILKIKNQIKIANSLTIMLVLFVASSIYFVTIFVINFIIQGYYLDYYSLFTLLTTAIMYPVIANFMQLFNVKKY